MISIKIKSYFNMIRVSKYSLAIGFVLTLTRKWCMKS